jgi:predicted O-methyltransferase YrrM
MIGGLVRGLQPELTVETGTYLGQTSIAIGQALKANGHGRLVTIEPSARHHRYAARKCRNLPVQCVLGEALQWVPQPGETIDFIFFDSSWDSRLREFDHFYPHMNRFTILAWHDTGTQFRYFRNFILSLSRITTPLLLPTARGICLARAIK